MPRGKKAIWLAVALALMLSLVGWGVAARPASAVTPLTITTTSLPDGGVVAPYSQTLHASGGTGSYTWARITGLLPAGLSLNSATGVISGTPTTAATFSFVVQVKDGVSSVTKGLSIKIYPRLSTLSINTTTLPAGDVGTVYSQPLSASGGSPPYTWSITVPSLPAGLSLNSATGVISGPTTTPGTSNFTVQVTDGSSTVTKPLSITINAQLTIDTSSLPNGHAGVAYSQTLHASGGSGSYTWSLFSDALPPGLAPLSATGVISGTPTTVGTSNFTVQVADGIGTATQPLSITIDTVLTITTPSLPNGHAGVAYSQTLHASGGSGSYSWSITLGSLPHPLTLDSSTGIISGTPDTPGTSNFTVQVNDGTSTATKPLSITINAGLTIDTTSLPGGVAGVVYSQTLHASGGSGSYTWSITLGSLPPVLLLNSSTGVISGPPTTPGTWNFTVQVNDGTNTATQPLSITIGGALIITTTSLPGGDVGAVYSQPLHAAGGTGSYTWSKVLGILPPGLSLNPATGVISGTPTTAATYSFVVKVADGISSITKGLSIRIYPQLTITTNFLPGGDVGMAYSQPVHASGGAGAGSYTWSKISGDLPDGLTLNSATGVISGPPTTVGTFNFTIQVADGIDTASKALSIKINPQLTIDTATLPNGDVGTFYSQPLHASGGSGSYTWAITVGSLPAVLTLNSATGVISGTPTLAGTYNFTVRVNDGIGPVTKGLQIKINAVLTITTSLLADGTVDIAYSPQTLHASGGGGGGSYTWSILGVVNLPPGLTLNSSTGVISGTPTTAGTYNFTARVTDGIGLATKPLSIKIGPSIKIVFTTLAWTRTAGQVSPKMTIQTQDKNGIPVNVSGDTIIALTSTSGNGKFYSDAGVTEITQVTILNGTNSADFYYKDTTAGTPTITAAESPSQAWTDGTQEETINPAAIDHYTVTSTSYTQTAGVAFTVTVTAYDQYNNLCSNDSSTQVTMSSTLSPPLGHVVFDGDGDGTWDNNVKTLGAGTFDIPAKDETAESPHIIASDGNGKTGSNLYTVNAAAASHLEVTGSATMTAGTDNNLTITAKDQYGNVDTSYPGGNSWKLLSFSGPGDAPDGQKPTMKRHDSTPPLVLMLWVRFTNGISDANDAILTAYKAETTTVDVTDGTINSFGNAAYDLDLTVNPDTASRLEVTGTATMTAGTNNELTITAKDQYGNVDTNYSGGKNLTFSGPGNAPDGTQPTVEGTIIGNATSVNFTSGVSDANAATLIAYKAETTTVDVSDGSIDSSGDAAYDLDLTVNPAAIDYYTVTSAGGYSYTAGETFTVTVKAYDQYDNLCSNDSSTVVTMGSHLGTPGHVVFDSNNDGTFDDNTKTLINGTFDIQAKDETAESPTITATDGTPKTGSSSVYTIDPAGIDHYWISHIDIQPEPEVAGVPFSVTIQARDAYNNDITSGPDAAETVDISFGQPDGGATPTSVVTALGTVTFDMTMTVAQDDQSLTFQGESSLVSSTSNEFDVVPGAIDWYMVTSTSYTQTAGVAFWVTVTAYDEYDNLCTNDSTTQVAMSSSTGHVAFDGEGDDTWDYNVGTLTNGTFGIAAKDNTAENVSINATDGNDKTGSNEYTIDPASIDHYWISHIDLLPEPEVAGVPFSVTIQAQDVYNNNITSGSDASEWVDINPEKSDAGADPEAVLTASGTITFDMTMTVAQDGQRLVFTGYTSGKSGTSNYFDVSPGEAAYFTFDSIDDQTAGEAFSITITAYDDWDNVATGFTGTADLSDLSDTISPTTTTGGFTDGVWTGEVTITKAYPDDTITADDIVTITGTSNTFDVDPGAVDHYTVTSGGYTYTAGVAFTVTVTAYDQYDNVCSNDSSTVVTMDSHLTGLAHVVFDANNDGTFGDNVKTLSAGTFDIQAKDNTAENPHIVATDGNDKTGTSSAYTINPAAIDHYSVTAIGTPKVAGTAFSVTIQAQDFYNNNITTGVEAAESINITFGLADAGATPTTTATVGGTVTVSDMTMTVAQDNQSITFTGATSSKSGTSNNFDVKDETPPTSSITFPANNGNYNASGWTAGSPISGSASDTGSGVQKVEVSIKDTTDINWWDGDSWEVGQSWLLASGTTSWTYSLTSGNLTDGHSYLVQSRATDNASNVETPGVGNSFSYAVNYYVNATGGDDSRSAKEAADPDTPWLTIQHAVNTVPEWSIIHVAAGTYTENVNVNKSLTLTGASSATVTVTAANPAVSVFNVTASSVNISGFTVTGANVSTTAGIYLGNDVALCDISNNILTGNGDGIWLGAGSNHNTFTGNTLSSNYQGFEVYHSDNNTFTNNHADSNTHYGFKMETASYNTFTGNTANSNTVNGFYMVKGPITGSPPGCLNNTFTNNTANSNTQYGIRIDNGDLNTLTGNTFNSNGLAGLRLKEVLTNLTVDHNNITNNPIGIDIAAPVTDVSTWTVNYNNISGNTVYGISNLGTGILNALYNWWGDATGPDDDAGVINGLGDKISVNVNAKPWYATATTTPGTQYVTVTGSPVRAYSDTIQGGIDAAVPGNTVSVAAGTYNESVTVNKSLTLLGAKSNVDPRAGAWTGDITTINAGEGNNGILITASGVTVNGFKITGSGLDAEVFKGTSAIYVYNETTELEDIVITYNWVDNNYGSGIIVRYANEPVVEYNYISCNGNWADWTAWIGGDGTVTGGWAAAGIGGQELINGSFSYNECFHNVCYGIYLGGEKAGYPSARPISGTLISHNDIHDNATHGLELYGYYDPPLPHDVRIENNNFHDNDCCGIKITDFTNTIVKDNQFTDNGSIGDVGQVVGPNPQDKYKYGALVSAYYASTGTQFTGNTFSGNELGGIYFLLSVPEADLSGITVNNNNFLGGSAKTGIMNTTASLIDATRNWWGDPTGPYHPDTNPSATGNEVSDNVDYSPWLGAEVDMSPMTWGTNDSIQDAIDAASSGDTIIVATGTYTENVNVNKSLTLTGASSATVTVTAAINTLSVFTVTASNVNISGFTATGTLMSGNQGYAGIKFGAGVANCNIHDNILSSNQYGILLLESLGNTAVGNNAFTSNTASNCIVSGIEMQNTNGNTFTNNIANSNGSQGFRLANAKNNTFTGNTANSNGVLGNSNGGCGFFLVIAGGTGSNDNTFTNNTANSNINHGIRIDSSTGNTLTGNTCNSNGSDGIKLKTGDNNTTLNNNTCSLNSIGIEIANADIDATTLTVHYNNISGNTVYGVSNNGTGTLNAEYNWWGSVNGPGADGANGVHGLVDYTPWLPMSSITFPANAGSYNSGTWTTISGTASGGVSGIQQVEVSIKDTTDNKWWDGDSWEAGQTWLLATGTDSWTYSLASASLTGGHSYLVQSRATDNGSHVEVPGAGNSFSYTA